MMKTQEEVQVQHKHYKRHWHHANAVGISWALLTCCFLIINIIVFAEPQWIGDTDTSPGTGWIGLFEYCELVNSASLQVCGGFFQDFSSILSDPFRASTFFIGVSVLLIFLCILLFLFFLFIEARIVYIMCGCLQIVSTAFMFLGCVIYPRGWGNIMIQRICGPTGMYNIGQCAMRWAYILAIIGTFDILILCILAFVLAFKQADKWKKYEPKKAETGAGYMIEVAPSMAGQSKAGSVIMSHGGPRSTLGGDQYASQPLYVVDNGGRARAQSSDFVLQQGRVPYGSEMQLARGESSGSVFRSRHDSL